VYLGGAVYITGNTIIDGNVSFNSSTTFPGGSFSNLDVTGKITAGSIESASTITTTSLLTSNLTASGPVVFQDTVTFNSNVIVQQTIQGSNWSLASSIGGSNYIKKLYIDQLIVNSSISGHGLDGLSLSYSNGTGGGGGTGTGGPSTFYNTQCSQCDIPPTLKTPAEFPSLILPGAEFGIDYNRVMLPTYFAGDVHFCSSNNTFFSDAFSTTNGNVSFGSNVSVNTLQVSNLIVSNPILLPYPFINNTCSPEDDIPPILDMPGYFPSLLLPGAQFGTDKNIITLPTVFEGEVAFCNSNVRFYVEGLHVDKGSIIINSNLTVTNNLYVDQNAIIDKNLTVYGTTTFHAPVSVPQLSVTNLVVDNPVFLTYPFVTMPCTEEDMVKPILENSTEVPSLIAPGALFGVDKNMFTLPTVFESDVVFCNSNVRFYLDGFNVNNGSVDISSNINAVNVNTSSNLYVAGSTTLDGSLWISGATTFEGLVTSESKVVAEAGIDSYACIFLYNHNHTMNGYWKVCNVANNHAASDLRFISNNGTVVTFTDDFSPDVLNFTGKHRCQPLDVDIVCNKEDLKQYIGKLVYATGKYKNLLNTDEIIIDEAIPIVDVVKKAKDPRVFGVISGCEWPSHTREYKLGTMNFSTDKHDVEIPRFIINSVGEGAIWVCSQGGPLQNGDLLTSSDIPGYAMKQEDDIVRNYTVAKITCDCDFTTNSTVVEMMINEQKIYKAWVGCVYLL